MRVFGLCSNCLEDPGIISDEGAPKYAYLGKAQAEYLTAALKRVKRDKFTGAVLIAAHHPPYVVQKPSQGEKQHTLDDAATGNHGGSPLMLKDIDSACEAAGGGLMPCSRDPPSTTSASPGRRMAAKPRAWFAATAATPSAA